jgi:hypothetical protein
MARSTKFRSISVQRQCRIRSLFLQPAESYHLAEGARLLGVSPGKLKREASFDRCEAYRRDGKWCFTWRQLALIAFKQWTLAEIVDALGADAAAVLPPLLALRSVTLRLPEYILRALETIAAEGGTTVDAILHGELLDFAGTVADRMESKVPGLRSAYHFPTPCPKVRRRRM